MCSSASSAPSPASHAFLRPLAGLTWRCTHCRLLSGAGAITLVAVGAAPSKQHFLYFLPLPQGHGSFRPILMTCSGEDGLIVVLVSEFFYGFLDSHGVLPDITPDFCVGATLYRGSICGCSISPKISTRTSAGMFATKRPHIIYLLQSSRRCSA